MKNILIDAGGIIIDTRELADYKKQFLERYRQLYGIKISPEDFLAQFKKEERNILKGISPEGMFQNFFNSFQLKLGHKENQEILQAYLDGYKLNKFYRGALQLLSSLKKAGCKIYIASDAIERGKDLDKLFSDMLTRNNISQNYKDFYTETITSSDLGVMKKESALFFEKMLQLLNIPKEEALFIAHDAQEIDSAQKAGILVYVFDSQKAGNSVSGQEYYEKVFSDIKMKLIKQ